MVADTLPGAHQLGARQQRRAINRRLGLGRLVLDLGVELGLMGGRKTAEGQFLDALGQPLDQEALAIGRRLCSEVFLPERLQFVLWHAVQVGDLFVDRKRHLVSPRRVLVRT